MTRKLYDEDAYLSHFTARVLSCRPEGKAFWVLLDQTAFFPEEGGQSCDTGTLGEAKVLAVRLSEGEVWHKTDRPLPPEEEVAGQIDFAERFRKMQNHTAEHMFSGYCHRAFGANNVGFHLGSVDMTADLDLPLSQEQLAEAEAAVNRFAAENRRVMAEYPDPETLGKMEYRSKLALTQGVRVVTVEGVDACACCAPHVKTTAEIGVFKILQVESHKGGVRVHMLAGLWAFEELRRRHAQVAALAESLSVKRDEVEEAVARLEADRLKGKGQIAVLQLALAKEKVKHLPECGGAAIVFTGEKDPVLLQLCAVLAQEKNGGLGAAFGGKDGDYMYVIAGGEGDELSPLAPRINQALGGKGGGRGNLLRGTAAVEEAAIRRGLEEIGLEAGLLA